jgi:hypothetical protein
LPTKGIAGLSVFACRGITVARIPSNALGVSCSRGAGESRADAYVRIRPWDVAITSLHVGGSVLLMNVDQFRAIYPEYQSASDRAQ